MKTLRIPLVIALVAVGGLIHNSNAQTVITLHAFAGGTEGVDPEANLVQGNDSNFYGSTFGDGSGVASNGTVFKFTSAGTLTTLYTFTGGADGAGPAGAMALGKDGNFYGTTAGNGSGVSSNGTVFKITPAGTLTTLHRFTADDGQRFAEAGMIQGSDSNFYDTTSGVGGNGYGTVFKITPAGTLTTLYSFTGGADGGNPSAGLVQGHDGNFYGTTTAEEASGNGTVFKITPAGTLTTLYSFTGGVDGSFPAAGLVQGSDSNFYGTTTFGGTNDVDDGGDGTIFKITSAGTLTTLYNFDGGSDGSVPHDALVQGHDGNFYGTASEGGVSGVGAVFKITSAGTLTVLYNFLDGPDAGFPEGLVLGSDGGFYGITDGEDTPSDGTIFKLVVGDDAECGFSIHSTNGFAAAGGSGTISVTGSNKCAWTAISNDSFITITFGGGGFGNGTVGYRVDANSTTLTRDGSITVAGLTVTITQPGVPEQTLYSFDGDTDGEFPEGGLVQGSDGNFYGTTVGGGSNGQGTVFQITPAGTLTVLYTFSSAGGGQPEAGLVRGSDGNFYGTTSAGGASTNCFGGCGTVFRISPSGVETNLHSFGGFPIDGNSPAGELVQGNDGNFYGTTAAGGSNGDGTVFRISPSGSYTNLYSFGSIDNNDGEEPDAGLLQGVDGNFYGTTSQGGTNDCFCGTVFRISPSGSETILYSFGRSPTDGEDPEAGLVLGADGNFYGTTYQGGTNDVANGGDGTVFRISPSGNYTNLYSFGSVPNDGENPSAALVQGSDGNFYGTTYNGGINDEGTVFRITPNGSYTNLYSFDDSTGDGENSSAALVQGSDGSFYGTTISLDSTVFRLAVPLNPVPNQISRLKLTGANIVVSVPSIAGETYQLQFSSSLTPTNWVNVPSVSITNSIGALLTLTNFGGGSQPRGFYRFDITP